MPDDLPPIPAHLPPAAKLVEAFLRYDGRVSRDERGDILVHFPTLTGFDDLRLGDRDLRFHLGALYLDYNHGQPPPKGVIGAAIELLGIHAINMPKYRMHNRFARVGRTIYIDLADGSGRVVQVDEAGWKIIRNAPVRFRRHLHQRALPVPQRGGDLGLLLRALRLPSGDEWLLVVGWVLWAMVEGVPHPVLLFVGGTDSGKTTTARLLRSAIDPSVMATVIAPKGLIEIALALDAHAVPVFDNVTRLSQTDTDLMCQVVSGAGFQKRKLKTDTDSIILDLQRPVAMTSIPRIPSSASDFLNRCLRVEIPELSDEERRDETDMWNDFHADAPLILGALLDLQVEALRAEREVVIPALPRMSGYARRGEAMGLVLGRPRGQFVELLNRNIARVADDVVFADPVTAAVRDLGLAEGAWVGTALRLLGDLARYWRPHDPRDRPKSEDALGRRLRIARPVLARVGIEVTFPRSGDRANDRLIRICVADPVRAAAYRPSVRSVRSVRTPGSGGNGGGGTAAPAGLLPGSPHLLPPHGSQGEA